MVLSMPRQLSYLWFLPFALGTACSDEDSGPEREAPTELECSSELEIRTTAEGVDFVRTPPSCFDGLPDWSYEAQHVEIEGLRQGYVDEGPMDGPVILMLHGQPSWSYLYRHMIPSLTARGYRAIAMDHLGMGLSDKPVDLDYHSFENHVARLAAFIDALGLQDITLFAQDWGSIIGLYLAGDDLERFSRIVIGNGGLPIVEAIAELPSDIETSNAEFEQTLTSIPERQPPFFDEEGNPLLPVGGGSGTEPFGQWMGYARFAEGFKASLMLEALTFESLSDREEQAYDAPFPNRIAFAAPRIFPSLRNELVGITQERRDALTRYERPFLTIFGGNDPGLSGEGDGQAWMMAEIPGAQTQPHVRFPDASHFLQDDKGPEIADRIVEFIEANP